MEVVQESSLHLTGNSVFGIVFEQILNTGDYFKKHNIFLKEELHERNDVFFSVIEGKDKDVNIMSQSSQTLFLDEVTTIITTQFDVSEEISYFLRNKQYSMFVMSLCESRSRSTKYIPIGVAVYHYSPSFGLFCPIIAVHSKYQSNGVGKSLLGRLQTCHYQVYNGDNRMFIWLNYLCKEKRNCDHGFGLYKYYQKLGMTLVDPNDLFIRSIVPADLFAKIQSFQILPSEDLQDACYSYNFVLGTYSKLYVFGKQPSIIFKIAKTSKDDHLCVKTEHFCDVCGISNKFSLKSTKKSTFVLCGHKSRSSTRSLESIHSDSLTPICGSFMCYTCHNIFGFNSIKYCPIHLTSDVVGRMNLGFHNKTMAKNMSNEVSNFLQSKSDRELFFQPKRAFFSYDSKKHQKPVSCKHCHINQTASNLLPQHTTYMNPDVSVQVNGDYNTKFIGSLNHMKKISNDRMACVLHKDCNHAPFFTTNVGNSWSLISNSVFSSVSVLGHGDCGILSLKYAIESLPTNTFQIISTLMFNYVCDEVAYWERKEFRMEKVKKEILNHYPKEKKKQGGVKKTFSVSYFKSLDPAQQLSIIFLRYMLFFSKVDLKYIDIAMSRDQGTINPEDQVCPYTKESILEMWFDDLLFAVGDNGDHKKSLNQVHIDGLHSFRCKILERQKLKDNGKDFEGVNNELVKLIGSHAVYWAEIYSKNAASNHLSYFITTMDFASIPYITGNRLGILFANEHSSYDNLNSSSIMNDGDYFNVTGRYLLKDVSNFVAFKLSQNNHYDLIIDTVNTNAIHPIPKNDNDIGDKKKYVAYKKLLSIISNNDKKRLIGVKCPFFVNEKKKEVDDRLLVITDIYDYCVAHVDTPIISVWKDSIEYWLKNTKKELLETQDLYNLAHMSIPWIQHSQKWLDSYHLLLDTSDNKNVELYFLSREVGEFIPFTMNCADFDDPKDCLFGIGYIRKVTSKRDKESFAFTICDLNQQGFVTGNSDKFVTKYIEKILQGTTAITKLNGVDIYQHHAIIDLLKRNEISLVTEAKKFQILRNVIHAVISNIHRGSGPFTQDIFEKIQVIGPGPVPDFQLELRMRNAFKKLCQECTTSKMKQEYYSFYVAYCKEEHWVHRHLLVYGFNYTYIVKKFLFQKYPELFENSFVLQTHQSLRKNICRFFLKSWNNQKQTKTLLKRVAKILCHMFFFRFTTCLKYMDEEKIREFDAVTSNLHRVDNESVVTNTDGSMKSMQSSVLNDNDVLASKHLNTIQSQHPKQKLNYSYESESSADSVDNVNEEDATSESSSSTHEHSTNWYKVPRVCENYDFKTVLSLNSCEPNNDSDSNFALLNSVSEKPISLEKILLIFTYHRGKEKALLNYVLRYMKKYLKDDSSVTNLHNIIKLEWKNVVRGIITHMGHTMEDTHEGESLYVVIKDKDIETERKRVVSEKDENMNKEGSNKNKSNLGCYKWTDFYKTDELRTISEPKMKSIEEAVRTIASGLNKKYEECKKFSESGFHVYQGAIFEKRPPSESFDYPSMENLDDTIFQIEEESIRLRNATDILDNSGSLRIKEIDLSTRIFNEEARGKTDCFCIPIQTFHEFYTKNSSKNTLGSIDKDLIASLVSSIGSFMSTENTMKDIFKRFAFISPNLNKSHFHYTMVLVDLEKDSIQLINGTSAVLDENARSFFFNIISIVLLLFNSWDDWNGTTIKTYVEKFSFPPPETIQMYNESLNVKASSVVLLMNLYGYITRKMPLYSPPENKNINLYHHKNLKYFRNHIISIFMQYSGCKKIEERKNKICSENIQETYFSDNNLLNDTFKLKVSSGVPNAVQVTKDTSKDKNTPTNDNKSVTSTKSVSSIGTESAILDDFSYEASHLVNFHNEERDSNHLRQQVGGKDRRKTVIGKTKKSIHCPNEVQEHNEVSYDIMPKQKANLLKLPKRIEVDEEEKGNFNQIRVHTQIGYAKNKLPCTHICCLDNRYAVTCSKTIIKDDIKKYMREHKLSEREMMDNKVLSPKNVFPLEIECIEVIRSKRNKKIDFNSFLRTLTGKKQWIKMPVAFKKDYMHFLKQKIEAWAYHYMDFHAISYNR